MRLICAGVGRQWALGFADDGQRVWRLADGLGAQLPGVLQLWPEGDGVVAVACGRFARFGPDGVTLGVGAPGPHRLWDEDGFLFRTHGSRTDVIDVLARAERWSPGPRGAAAVGSREVCTRAAPPGRAARALPEPLAWGTERWSDDGTVLAGVGEDEQHVTIDVLAGVVRDRGPVVHPPHGSAARWEDWLAGPGGRVWSLVGRAPIGAPGVIPLGVVVPTPHGFVVVDWETNAGWTVPYDHPRRTAPFSLPIDADDTPVAGGWIGGAACVRTALGEVFAIRGAEVSASHAEVPSPPDPTLLDTELGPFRAAGIAEVDGTRIAWDAEGWIVAV